jgi:hypothetical protein
VRTVLLAAAIVALTLHQAWAQFGDMPGLPGGPGPELGGPPTLPPAQCQKLRTLRDEVQKHGRAVEAANHKKANVQVACKLFRNYLAAESNLIKAIDADGARCGVLLKTVQQLTTSHANTLTIAKRVCDTAARGPARGMLDLGDDRDAWPPDPSRNQQGRFPTGDFWTRDQLQRLFGR